MSRSGNDVAAIEAEMAELEAQIALHPPKDELERQYDVVNRDRLRHKLLRAKRAQGAALRRAALRGDPLQTDIEREVEAESAAHGPDLGGSRKRGR